MIVMTNIDESLYKSKLNNNTHVKFAQFKSLLCLPNFITYKYGPKLLLMTLRVTFTFALVPNSKNALVYGIKHFTKSICLCKLGTTTIRLWSHVPCTQDGKLCANLIYKLCQLPWCPPNIMTFFRQTRKKKLCIARLLVHIAHNYTLVTAVVQPFHATNMLVVWSLSKS